MAKPKLHVFLETADDKGINLKISFDGVQYLVEVYKDKAYYKKTVPCSFTPTFGMDVLDQNACFQVAEDLAQKVEKDLTI